MQQTEKYKLNLIETSDTFSPQALNENAQKTEAAIDAARAEAAAGDAAEAEARAALDQRVAVLEAHHMVVGSYPGTGVSDVIGLGFTPGLVMVISEDPHRQYIAIGNAHPDVSGLYITEGGFQVIGGVNQKGMTFFYFALG